ncbi:hypothetical protein QE397_000101 [Rhodococcus sp. SORGH_AS 301]|nr:hypothetical protein [Rhodococcus sp. SORGH_AS_0301]
MSNRKRRAAFNPELLGDLADVLPPVEHVRISGGHDEGNDYDPVNSDAAAEPLTTLSIVGSGATEDDSDEDHLVRSAPQHETTPSSSGARQKDSTSWKGQSEGSTTAAVVEDTSTRRRDARRRNTRRDSSTTPSRIAPPEVALPQAVYVALRSLTLDERNSNPATARSYGQVVLDAVEKHADELKDHWVGATSSASSGLFKRAEAGRPTRRRHQKPRARVPLAGVINADASLLDQLAIDWGAGSRSALVEEALRRYLDVSSAD